MADTRNRESELTALMISPNRDLAGKFLATVQETKAFQILSDLKSYPPRQTLDIRLRQLKPDVVLVDVATNLEQASDLIRFLSSFRPVTQVVGLHTHNDSEAIVRTLRLGASEFLYGPFEVKVMQEAIARICRLRVPERTSEPEIGRVLVFCSAKPGSGASTLASQTAFALRRLTGQRVLLVDLDTAGGTVAFYLKLHHNSSVMDAFERAEQIDPTLWASLIAHCDGIEVLPAPEGPELAGVEPNRLHDVLEFARMLYDWVILDGPAIPHRSSLLAVSESDEAFLVSTTELGSLHLTRRAVTVLEQLGFGKDRFRVLINRSSKRDGIGSSDMEKIFNCPVHAMFPNDYFSLHRVISLGQALDSDTELGKSVESLSSKLMAAAKEEKKRLAALIEEQPA
ncbi:MAG: MinD/ParA family protein [bacterium]|nr:MinD/ParA family protein [bacterium]